MKDKFGVITSDYPSVSKVVKNYYEEFDAQRISGIMSKGDEVKQQELLNLWKEKGEYAANMGSRVHYFLEKFLIDTYNNPKEIREPFFECNEEQIKKSEKMILAGELFVRKMQERNAVLLDTELVLGDCSLGYVGQPDKVWLVKNNQGTDYGFVITDWKTNNPENFEPQRFTKKMLAPFDTLDSTALGHYSIQLPLYGRLLCKMLEGTDFESKKIIHQFRQYPPFIGLLYGWLISSGIEKVTIIFPVLYVCLLYIFYYRLYDHVGSSTIAAAATLILGTTPYLWWHSYLPFLDWTAGVFYVAGVLYWFLLVKKIFYPIERFNRDQNKSLAILSGFFFGLAGWTRPEFLIYSAIPIFLLVCAFDRTNKPIEERKLIIAYFSIASLIARLTER